MNTTNEHDTDAPDLLPPGHYRARADKATVTFGRASTGNDQVAITFDITDPKADGYPSRVTWIGTLGGGALDITLDGIMAAGWTGTDLLSLDGIGDVECSLKIKHEADREGVPRLRVDFVNPLRGAFKFKEALDENGVADLSQRLSGAIMAARERAGSKGTPNPGSGSAGARAGGGYGPPARTRQAAPAGRKEWDGTGADPNGGEDIPF